VSVLLWGASTSAQQSGEADSSPSVLSDERAADMVVERIGLIDLDGVLRASEGTARVRGLLDEQRREFQREFAAREAGLQETDRKLVV
ncbi:MAG: hypothetical protein VW619_06140, partial [Rhodobiaceae bacterium]